MAPECFDHWPTWAGLYVISEIIFTASRVDMYLLVICEYCCCDAVTTVTQLRRLVKTRLKSTWCRRRCRHSVNAPASLHVPALTCSPSEVFSLASCNTATGTSPLPRRWTWRSGGATASVWRHTVARGKATLTDTSRAVYSIAHKRVVLSVSWRPYKLHTLFAFSMCMALLFVGYIDMTQVYS